MPLTQLTVAQYRAGPAAAAASAAAAAAIARSVSAEFTSEAPKRKALEVQAQTQCGFLTQASLLAETQAVNKRYRQAIDEVAEEYVCPITAELPMDPVTAEDGRCYERCAIEEWFRRQPQPRVKSPITNELMGKRLLPAVQLRNTLKRLVESGAISGSKADAWKKVMADEAIVAALRAKAEGGDVNAMRALGIMYRNGTHGLKKDATLAFKWISAAGSEGLVGEVMLVPLNPRASAAQPSWVENGRTVVRLPLQRDSELRGHAMTLGRHSREHPNPWGIKDPRVSRCHVHLRVASPATACVMAMGANPVQVVHNGSTLTTMLTNKSQECTLREGDQINLVVEEAAGATDRSFQWSGDPCAYRVSFEYRC